MPFPIDADLRLRAEGLKARQIELGALSARLQSDRQQATVTIDELQAYGGRLAATARAKQGSPPTYALDLQSQGIRLLPAAAGADRPGRFDGQAEIRPGPGDRRQQSAAARPGPGRRRQAGAARRCGPRHQHRRHAAPDHDAGPESGATQQQRTDFAEAGGSFKIQNGIVRNDDLYLRAPVLRLDGAGSIDLPQRTVDYRITPQLATTLEGQGASGTPALQAGIPFLVQGPFAAPSVRFDLNGTLTGAVSSPADLARVAGDLAQNPQAVQLLQDQFDLLDQMPAPAAGKARDLIEGVLGGGAAPKGGQPKDAPNLGDAARGLLKGFGRHNAGDVGLDLILTNARLADPLGGDPIDLGIADGRIAAIGHDLSDRSEAPVLDVGGGWSRRGSSTATSISTSPAVGERCRCERGDTEGGGCRAGAGAACLQAWPADGDPCAARAAPAVAGG